jgi:hypothetical protein
MNDQVNTATPFKNLHFSPITSADRVSGSKHKMNVQDIVKPKSIDNPKLSVNNIFHKLFLIARLPRMNPVIM